MPSHPRLTGDSRIFVPSLALKCPSLSPTFYLNHPQPSAFCLMETILSQRTFSQEEKQNTGSRSIQICHQINYVCLCASECVLCVCMCSKF